MNSKFPTEIQRIRRCEICKQEIDAERAELLPVTRLCDEHAREITKYGGEFTAVGTQASFNKVSSLKKNYGDVGIEKHRNHDAIAKQRDAYQKSN